MIEIRGLKFPLDRKYYTMNGAHLWLKYEGDLFKIGMDAFASEVIGVITVLIIDKKKVKSGETIGSFESTKYISKLYSPISGEIVDVNNDVLTNPTKINKNPYNSWIFKIKPDIKVEKNKYIIEDEKKILNWITDEMKKIEIKDKGY